METEVFQYNINNPGDETVFVAFSMKPLSRQELGDKLSDFLKTVTHSPSRFRQEIVVFDDRPSSIR
jgi:hypothetical protein